MRSEISLQTRNFPYLIRIEYILVILLLLRSVFLCLPAYSNFLYYRLSLIFFILYLASGRIYLRLNTGLVLFLICLFFYQVGLIRTLFQGQGLDRSNIIDLANIVCFLFLWMSIREIDEGIYHKFLGSFTKYAVYATFIIAIVSIYKLQCLMDGIQLDWVTLDYQNNYPWGTSLIADYNIYCLGLLSGLVACYYYYPRVRFFLLKIFIIATVLLASFCVAMSGSRRGLVALGLLLVSLIYTKRKSILTAPARIFRLSLKKFIWLILIISLISLVIYIEYNTIADYVLEIEFRLGFLFERYDTIISGLTGEPQELGARVTRLGVIKYIFQHSSFSQLLLGTGFDYFIILSGDYPHNFFLSSMFYSGIIGTIPLLIMYIYVMIEAVKKRKLLGPFIVWIFGLTCFFYFFSDNSIFSSATYLILMVIIFAIKSDSPDSSQTVCSTA